MRKPFLLLVWLTLFLACSSDDLEVTLIQNGDLEITLVDDDALPIVGATVELIYFDNELDSKVTDASGRAQFGTLNTGEYVVTVNTKHRGKEFNFTKAVQVVSAINKNYNINIDDYVGEINIRLREQFSSEPFAFEGAKLALVPRNDAYEAAFTWNEILALSVEKETTDSEGKVTFTGVPINNYVIYLYGNEGPLDQDFVFIERKEETEFVTFFVNSFEIVSSAKDNWSVESIVTNSGGAVDHNYSTVILDAQNADITLKRVDGSDDVAGDFTYTSSYVLLDWGAPLYTSWFVYYENVRGNEIIARYYDHTVDEEVKVTLK